MILKRIPVFFSAFASLLLWAPPYRVDTPKDIVETLNRVLHGVDRNFLNFLPYGANLPQVFANAQPYVAALGENLAPLEIPDDSPVHIVEYLIDEEINYSPREDTRSAFRQNLISIIENSPLRDRELKGIVVDINFLAEQKSQFTFGKKEASVAFFILVPFLYDNEGNPRYSHFDESTRAKILSHFDELSPRQIQGLYRRPLVSYGRYSTSLSPAYDRLFDPTENIKYPEQIQILAKYFADKFLSIELPRFTYYAPPLGHRDHLKANVRANFLSLEEVSPLEALLRGEWAGDCSTENLAYYPLLKKIRAFKLSGSSHNKKNPHIRGYALVVEVKVNGERLPYLFTVNSQAVDRRQSELLVRLVSHAYGSSKILLPNLDINPRVTDNEDIRAIFQSYEGESRSDIEFPQGWDTLEELTAKNNKVDAPPNPYRSQNLRHAQLVSIGELRSPQTREVYKESLRIRNRPSEQNFFSTFVANVLARQHIELGQISDREAADLYFTTNIGAEEVILRQDSPTGSELKNAIGEMGFSADLLRYLPIARQKHILQIIHEEVPALAQDKEWKKAAAYTALLSEKIQLGENCKAKLLQ